MSAKEAPGASSRPKYSPKRKSGRADVFTTDRTEAKHCLSHDKVLCISTSGSLLTTLNKVDMMFKGNASLFQSVDQ
ncbi:MAG: hypothetical protein WCP28_17055 [Actinomycetes bacterium]